jgi:hypothetical protein
MTSDRLSSMWSRASFDSSELPVRCGTLDSVRDANGRSGGLSRGGRMFHPGCVILSRAKEAMTAHALLRFAQDDNRVDEYAAMHNNTSMRRASLAPVILLNTVRSTGATG